MRERLCLAISDKQHTHTYSRRELHSRRIYTNRQRMERKKDGGGGLKGTGAKRTAINVIDKVWAKHHMRLTNSPTRR